MTDVRRAIDSLLEGGDIKEVTNTLLEGDRRKVSHELKSLSKSYGKTERLEAAFQTAATELKKECKTSHKNLSRLAERYKAKTAALSDGLKGLSDSNFKSDTLTASIDEAGSSLTELEETLTDTLQNIGEIYGGIESVQGKVNRIFNDEGDDEEDPDAMPDFGMDGDDEEPGDEMPGDDEEPGDEEPGDEFPPEDGDEEEPDDDEEFPPDDDDDDDDEEDDDDDEFGMESGEESDEEDEDDKESE
jgi:hypothetical protein